VKAKKLSENMENLLVKCIPGVIDDDCEPTEIWIGGQDVSAAQILHGLMALLNVIAPPVLWFEIFEHGAPSTVIEHYESTYWGV